MSDAQQTSNALDEAEKIVAKRGYTSLRDLRTWESIKDDFADIAWVWPSWMAKGYVTMLAAAPGVGKSLLALMVAKLTISGGVWPDAWVTRTNDALALWIETESGEPFHISRCAVIGLPLQSVVTPIAYDDTDTQVTLTKPEHKARIEALSYEPKIGVVVVDSLSGGHDMDENSSKSGGVMQWLSAVAKGSQKPILVVHHMNKAGMSNNPDAPPSMASIRGTGAFLQHARTIWTLDTPDASRPEMLRLACVKSNLGVRPKPITIYIGEGGRLEFTSPVGVSSRDAMADYIRTLKAKNPTMTITQIARQEGMTETAVAEMLRPVQTNVF